jgi:hypothetical protein
MSVTSKARSSAALLLLASGLSIGGLGGCASFGSRTESTVAQGKYYASGNPYYDEFFVDLYLLQVGMAEAPKLPEAERQRWIQLLKLEPGATPAAIELGLHEEALKLSRTGVRLRLDQSLPVSGNTGAASTRIRSNARPKEEPAATLLATVETSSTELLRWGFTMKQKEDALSRLELQTIRLDAGLERAFAQSPVGKPNEVKENLADAHKLIPLMRARAEAVRTSTEQLLAALTHGINTDDGSIGPPIVDEPLKSEGAHEAGSASDPAKKAAGKPRPKGKAASPAAAPQAKPKAADGDGDEPKKPRATSGKPAPRPRDFEP